LKIKKKQRTN